MLTRFVIKESAITQSAEDSGPILVFVAPDDREKGLIKDQFQLDEFDLASTLDPDEVPRLESAGDRTLVIWKVPESARVREAVELGVRTLGLVVMKDQLAFIMSTGQMSFAEREFHTISNVHDVLLRFLHSTIRHYVGHLRVIRQLSGELEKKITVSMENKHLLQMFALSENLIYYLDSIEGNGAALAKLRALGGQVGLDSRQLQALDDIILENQQAARQANIYSSVLSGLMDARGTIINNNMNVLLKNLTLINIVFLPLNLIASIGGMSEWSMITHGLDWRVSYGVFTLGIAVFGWFTWIMVTRLIDKSGGRAKAGSPGEVDRPPPNTYKASPRQGINPSS